MATPQLTEGTELRRYLRDLIALSAMPAAWVGQSTQAALDSFTEALLRTLRAEFVYARIALSDESRSILESARTQKGAVDPDVVRDLPRAMQVPIAYGARAFGQVAIGGRPDTLVAVQLQPAEHARLLVQMSANQLAVALAATQLSAAQSELAERQRAQEALRRSEERFRALIERSSDMIGLLDQDGLVRYASESTTRHLGYTPNELMGRPAYRLVHTEDRDWLQERFQRLVEESGGVMTCRYRVEDKHGRTRWFETTFSNLLAEPAVDAVVTNGRDVTAEVDAQRLLEQRVLERTRELESLYQADEKLYRSLRLDDVLRALVEVSAEVLRVDKSTVMAHDVFGQRLVVRAAHGFAAQTLDGLTLGLDESIPARVLEAEGVQALLSVPVIANDTVFAIFTIYYTSPHEFADEEQRLLQALAHRAGLAIENARLYEAAHGVAALEERQRLARELHDSVSQALYAIGLNAAAAMELADSDPARHGALLSDVVSLAQAGLTEMRALIFELRPESLEQEGLVGALTRQAAAIEARYRLVVSAELDAEPDLPLAAKEALYRVAQEALQNVAKHARARSAGVRLELTQRHVVLSIMDDGRGFDPDGSFPGHLGLRSMRERVSALEGTLHIRSAPGQGTHVRVAVPLDWPSHPISYPMT